MKNARQCLLSLNALFLFFSTSIALGQSENQQTQEVQVTSTVPENQPSASSPTAGLVAPTAAPSPQAAPVAPQAPDFEFLAPSPTEVTSSPIVNSPVTAQQPLTTSSFVTTPTPQTPPAKQAPTPKKWTWPWQKK